MTDSLKVLFVRSVKKMADFYGSIYAQNQVEGYVKKLLLLDYSDEEVRQAIDAATEVEEKFPSWPVFKNYLRATKNVVNETDYGGFNQQDSEELERQREQVKKIKEQFFDNDEKKILEYTRAWWQIRHKKNNLKNNPFNFADLSLEVFVHAAIRDLADANFNKKNLERVIMKNAWDAHCKAWKKEQEKNKEKLANLDY